MIRVAAIALLAARAFAQLSDYQNGLAQIRQNEPGLAVPYLMSATAAHPADARVWEALGLAYAAQSIYGDAEPAFAHACKLNPKLEDACYYDARALYALERFEDSLAALVQADAAAPNSWKVHLAIAQALDGLGQSSQAEAAFHRAITLAHDTDPQPAVAFGLFFLKQARPAEAVSLIQQTLKAFPANPGAHLCLGRAFTEQGKFQEALPHLEQAVKLQPESAQAHLLLAKAYVRLGRASEAQPHFDAAANAVR